MTAEMTIFLLYLVTTSATRSSISEDHIEPFTAQAHYRKNFSSIFWAFTLYYGKPGENVDRIAVRFDFHYKNIIFVSDDLYNHGISCSSDFSCTFDPRYTDVTDMTGRRKLSVHSASVNLLINPDDFVKNPKREIPKLDFYFNNSDPGFINQNIIGINASSNFWPFLCSYYKKEKITILFETEVPGKSFKEISDDVTLIDTKMTFFPMVQINRGFLMEDISQLFIPDTHVKFKQLDFILQATFSYELPFLFKISSTFHSQIILAVKKVICLDPNKCESDSDMYANFFSKEKLVIVFENDYNAMMSEVYTVEFNIMDIFFLNDKGAIGYNIVSYQPTAPNQHFIIFGLKFLNKCNLMISYNHLESNFDLILFEKARNGDNNLVLFVFFSVFFASLISMFLVKKTRPSAEFDVIPSSSSSLQNLISS